jgi:hypothetical protein
MKKILFVLMVIGIAIPALAVDITLVDNEDGTGTIFYTAAVNEVVRGLAIIVETGVVWDGVTPATVPDSLKIAAVTDINAEFNVFMDHIFSNPGQGVGQGGPVANPSAAGTVALPAKKISLCMGVVKGNQGGAAANGTYEVATIETGCAKVTITADVMRGGIVGDNVTSGSITDGNITCCPLGYLGDGSGAGDVFIDPNDHITLDDLSTLVNFLAPTYADTIPAYTCPNVPAGAECMELFVDGKINLDDLTVMVQYLAPAYAGTIPAYVGPDDSSVTPVFP